MAVDLGTGYLEVQPKMDASAERQMTSRFSAVGSKMRTVGAGMSLGLTAPIVAFGKSAISAFEDSEKVAGIFRETLNNVGLAGQVNADRLMTQFENIGEAIGVEDEALTTLAGKVASAVDFSKFEGNAQGTLKRITLTIQNMSAQTGKSANTYAKLFATIANDPAAALTTLMKMGVITSDQADKYKKMIEQGKGAAVSSDLLTAAQKRYAGAAKAAATPTEKIGVAFGNFQEKIGAVLLPVLEKVFEWVTKLFDAFKNLSPGVQTAIVIVLAIVAALGPLLIILGTIISIAPAIGAAVTFMFGPWGLLIAAVIVGIILIVKNFDTLKAVAIAVWNAIKTAGIAVWNFIKAAALVVFNFFKTAIKIYLWPYIQIWKLIKAAASVAWKAIKTAVNAVLNWLKSFAARVLNGLQKAWGVYKKIAIAVWNALKGAATKFWGWIKGAADRVFNGLKRGWEGVKKVGTAIWDAIKGAAIGVFNAIAGAWNSTVGQLDWTVPTWVPGIGGNTIGVPDIPTFAKGGVVMGPTLAVLGEAGPEMVLPLSSSLRAGGLGGSRQFTGTLTLTPESKAYVQAIEDEDAGARARHARVLRRMGSAA